MIFARLDSPPNFCHIQYMKRPSKKLPKDPNKLAYEIVRMSTEDLAEDLGDSQPKTKQITDIKANDKNEK